jgi:hypothetical protein
MTDLDPDKIMAEHQPVIDGSGNCFWCSYSWPCLPYRLAEWLKIAEDEHKRLTAENVALRESLAAGTGETWLPVVGFEETHEVSDLGRVRSWISTSRSRMSEPRIVRGSIRFDGYRQFSLTKRSWLLAHRMVMAAFVGPVPDGQEICHRNGDRDDNRLANLRYDTHSENELDKVVHGTNLVVLTPDQIRRIRAEYVPGINSAKRGNAAQLAAEFGVCRNYISTIARGARGLISDLPALPEGER